MLYQVYDLRMGPVAGFYLPPVMGPTGHVRVVNSAGLFERGSASYIFVRVDGVQFRVDGTWGIYPGGMGAPELAFTGTYSVPDRVEAGLTWTFTDFGWETTFMGHELVVALSPDLEDSYIWVVWFADTQVGGPYGLGRSGLFEQAKKDAYAWARRLVLAFVEEADPFEEVRSGLVSRFDLIG